MNICSRDCSNCKIGEPCACGFNYQCVFSQKDLKKTCTPFPKKKGKSSKLYKWGCREYITTKYKPNGICLTCKAGTFLKNKYDEKAPNKCRSKCGKENYLKLCSKDYYCGRYKYRKVTYKSFIPS